MWVSPMHPDPNGAPVSPLGLFGAHPGQGALQLPAHPPPHTHTLFPLRSKELWAHAEPCLCPSTKSPPAWGSFPTQFP